MKVRRDFVTNSSSSSFIISTKQEVPSQYSDDIKLITKENVLDIIKQMTDYEWISITYEMKDEEFQKLGNFTDEQMMLIKLVVSDQLDTYLHLIKIVESEQDPIYHILVDRNWLYYQDVLQDFINNATLIDEKGDL